MGDGLMVALQGLQLTWRDGCLHLLMSQGDRAVGQASLGLQGLPRGKQPEVTQSEDTLTLAWPRFGSLTIKYTEHPTGAQYDMAWLPSTSVKVLEDNFSMGGSHWYGVGQIRAQHWPIESWIRKEAAFVAGDSFKDEQYGGVQERYWLSSRGMALTVDHGVPLFVAMNEGQDEQLRLKAQWAAPYKNLDNEIIPLNYKIFISSDVKSVHQLATGLEFAKPSGIPDELIFRDPIWSTWARYKKDISQKTVLEFAKEIKDNGFRAAQVEIDDDWTPHYGDMEFDSRKFPDPASMIEQLKQMGFRTTVWVHPFSSPMSKAASLPHWIRSSFLPGHTIWWNGVGKILDVTKPSACEWFKKCLLDLKDKYKFCSFKFDAGEVNWLPSMARPDQPWKNPNVYTTKYAELCHACDPDTRALEVRVGVQTQHLPVFVRMMDKDSNWGYNNGLKSLIPHALTFSVLGYPFILPDMIGGNAYGGAGIGSSSALPEPELYIRWLQATVFLPCLQFSLAPWQYSSEILTICREMCDLHSRYGDTFIALAEESCATGAPIIRPLWWVAPNDVHAQKIDDEFLVGDDLLVAPVLIKGAVSRDVYLPVGVWKDELTGEVVEGGDWINNYPASLSQLPHFTRTTEAANNVSDVTHAASDAMVLNDVTNAASNAMVVSDVTNAASDAMAVGDVTNAASDATQVEEDVTQVAGDVTKATSDVPLAASDVSLATSNIAQAAGDITLATSDVTQATSDVPLAASDITLATSDVTKATSDVPLAASDVTLATSDVILATSDVTLATSDVTQATGDVSVAVTVATAGVGGVVDAVGSGCPGDPAAS